MFWPMIGDAKQNSFHHFVKTFIEYQNPRHFFKVGSDINSIFAAEKFASNVFVLKVDFRK
jgi:hypothetical protein